MEDFPPQSTHSTLRWRYSRKKAKSANNLLPQPVRQKRFYLLVAQTYAFWLFFGPAVAPIHLDESSVCGTFRKRPV
jgi:hypothetical protein